MGANDRLIEKFLRLNRSTLRGFRGLFASWGRRGGAGGSGYGGDDGFEHVAEGVQAAGVFGDFVIHVFNIEGVDGDAALRADAGEGDVEAVIVDGFRDQVEQADLVVRLDLDDGSLHREFVVDFDDRRERTVQSLTGRLRGRVAAAVLGGLCHDVGIKIFVGYESLFDCLGKGFHRGLALHDATVGFDDVERVDGDMVGAGNDLGSEDVQACDAKGAGEFIEEAGAVPSDDVDDGEAAVEVVFPVDDGLERADGVRCGDRMEKFVHHLNVQRDLARIGVDEIAFGQQIEVRGDFVLADAWDRLGDQFLMLHLGTFRVSGFGGFAVDQAFQCGAEERAV